MQETRSMAETETYEEISGYDYQPWREYTVEPNDNLVIRINNFNGNTMEYLGQNPSSNGNFNGNGDGVRASIYMTSYTVSLKGTIAFPLIGEILVQGKTTLEIQETLNEKLQPHLKFPSTSVKLANYRVTVLGEVGNPGVYYIYNDYGTLFELLGMAGDLTQYANRKKVKIIRETEQGSKVAYLNLTKPDIVASPYYYVRPNDIIYLEPVNARAFQTNASTASIVVSVVSVATLIANLIVNSRK